MWLVPQCWYPLGLDQGYMMWDQEILLALSLRSRSPHPGILEQLLLQIYQCIKCRLDLDRPLGLVICRLISLESIDNPRKKGRLLFLQVAFVSNP